MLRFAVGSTLCLSNPLPRFSCLRGVCMPTLERTDIAVIGAGPVGLFAIFEAGMLKMRCHVIDALDATGGQCTALYPEKPIYDIPGHPAISAADLIDRLA